jgi:hypothetical protein
MRKHNTVFRRAHQAVIKQRSERVICSRSSCHSVAANVRKREARDRFPALSFDFNEGPQFPRAPV